MPDNALGTVLGFVLLVVILFFQIVTLLKVYTSEAVVNEVVVSQPSPSVQEVIDDEQETEPTGKATASPTSSPKKE